MPLKFFKLKKGVIRGRSTAFVVTVVVHVVAFVIAGSYVALTVLDREEPKFTGQKIARPKMKLKKLQVPIKVKKIRQPKFKKPNAPTKAPTMDFKMPAMSGMKGGLGAMGGGGMGSLGFGLKIGLFGSDAFDENEFVGTFYDLKQTPDRKSTGMSVQKYDKEIQRFLGTWKESVFEGYFQAPRKKYTSAIAMPAIRATEAPKAFGVAEIVKPALWLIHYKGRFVVPETGRYRFCGLGNDVMYVRADNRLVLDASWYRPGRVTHVAGKLSGWNNDDPNNRKFQLGETNGRMALGDWKRYRKGQKVEMEVLLGERMGTGFCSILLVEQDGKKYQMLGSRPILPIFKTKELPAELVQKMRINPKEYTAKGPVFGVKE